MDRHGRVKLFLYEARGFQQVWKLLAFVGTDANLAGRFRETDVMYNRYGGMAMGEYVCSGLHFVVVFGMPPHFRFGHQWPEEHPLDVRVGT
jgi:hypothetical protein